MYPAFLGNGEIDFDEFLALMTSTEKYLETVRTIISDGIYCFKTDFNVTVCVKHSFSR